MSSKILCLNIIVPRFSRSPIPEPGLSLFMKMVRRKCTKTKSQALFIDTIFLLLPLSNFFNSHF